MARFVLIHGAFCGAWTWDRLKEPLEAAGHTVETLDLPGSGADQTPVGDVTLEVYADAVGEVLAKGSGPAVLVANSMGGIAAAQAAANSPENVAGIVYAAAFVPQDGESLIALTEFPEGADDQVQANMVVSGEPPVSTLPQELSPEILYGSCSDDVATWAAAQQRPQPVAPFTEPVQIPDGAFDGTPRRYVICTRDRAIPPALQRKMIERAGITDVVELDTDHTPQLSATAELAEALDGFAG
jgi:pimeloyl-ACP methyl ester carboxylesterase